MKQREVLVLWLKRRYLYINEAKIDQIINQVLTAKRCAMPEIKLLDGKKIAFTKKIDGFEIATKISKGAASDSNRLPKRFITI